jgi:hypothetical protein
LLRVCKQQSGRVELPAQATCKEYLQVRQEGSRIQRLQTFSQKISEASLGCRLNRAHNAGQTQQQATEISLTKAGLPGVTAIWFGKEEITKPWKNKNAA